MIDNELEMELTDALGPKSRRQPLGLVFAPEYLGISDQDARDRENRCNAAQYRSSTQILGHFPLGELFHKRYGGAHAQAQEAEEDRNDAGAAAVLARARRDPVIDHE